MTIIVTTKFNIERSTSNKVSSIEFFNGGDNLLTSHSIENNNVTLSEHSGFEIDRHSLSRVVSDINNFIRMCRDNNFGYGQISIREYKIVFTHKNKRVDADFSMVISGEDFTKLSDLRWKKNTDIVEVKARPLVVMKWSEYLHWVRFLESYLYNIDLVNKP